VKLGGSWTIYFINEWMNDQAIKLYGFPEIFLMARSALSGELDQCFLYKKI
jgi:hypothetical protein